MRTRPGNPFVPTASGSPIRCEAEGSGGDFFAAILVIVAFAVGHLACLFDSDNCVDEDLAEDLIQGRLALGG